MATSRIVHIANHAKHVYACGRLLVDNESHIILRMTFDVNPPTINFNLPYTVVIPNREHSILWKKELLDGDSGWFTNGSTTRLDSGASYVKFTLNTGLQNPISTSCYQEWFAPRRLFSFGVWHQAIVRLNQGQLTLSHRPSYRSLILAWTVRRSCLPSLFAGWCSCLATGRVPFSTFGRLTLVLGPEGSLIKQADLVKKLE